MQNSRMASDESGAQRTRLIAVEKQMYSYKAFMETGRNFSSLWKYPGKNGFPGCNLHRALPDHGL